MKKNFEKISFGVAFVVLMMCMLCFGVGAVGEYTDGYYTYNLYSDGTACIMDVDESISGDVVIPETLGGHSVTGIGSFAFLHCENIESIEIHSGINFIFESAFSNCGKISGIYVHEGNEYFTSDEYGALYNKEKTELIHYPAGNKSATYTVPEGVKRINHGAFYYNEYIETVIFPDTVTEIGASVFGNCFNLRHIEIPEKVTRIEMDAFAYCGKLESVVLPEGLKYIGIQAFMYCRNLTELEIPDGVTNIDKGAFAICEKLEEVTIPSGIRVIRESTFSNCKSLKSITIPDNIESIENSAFGGCDGLTNIVIPANVANVGETAFCNSNSLESITVDKDNEFYSSDEFGVLYDKAKNVLIQYPIGNKRTEYFIPEGVLIITSKAFYNAEDLVDISMSNSVCTIEEDAFYGCRSLKQIKISDNVTDLYSGTFQVCTSLENITIPVSIKNIQYCAFAVCTSLSDVYYLGSEEDWNKINIDSYDNEALINADIHFHTSHRDTDNDSYCDECGKLCEHKFVTKTEDATCSVDGYSMVVCSICGCIESTEIFEATGHTLSDWTEYRKVTCTVDGENRKNCQNCDYYETEAVTASGHQWGEWSLTREPSLLEEGIETSVCAVCSEKQTRELPKKQSDASSTDENTGINVEYTNEAYEGDVEIVAEPDTDGAQYVTLPLEDFTKIASWNIKIYVNGEEVQPAAPVLVSIPLPEGFNPKHIAVYHIDSQTGEYEIVKPVYVEDGYVKFMASSFSVYTLVDESSEQKDGIEALFDWLTGLIEMLTEFFVKLFTFSC